MESVADLDLTEVGLVKSIRAEINDYGVVEGLITTDVIEILETADGKPCTYDFTVLGLVNLLITMHEMGYIALRHDTSKGTQLSWTPKSSKQP